MADDKVVDFLSARDARETEQAPDLIENRITGSAKCLSCAHEWIAVAHPGRAMFNIECPKCGTFRGQLVQPVIPSEETIVFQHKCGCYYYVPMWVKKSGFIAQGDADLRLVNTAGTAAAELVLLCVGCGDFVSFDEIA
jgi:hypothetical protein